MFHQTLSGGTINGRIIAKRIDRQEYLASNTISCGI